MTLLKIFFGIVVSGICLYLSTQHIDFSALAKTFNDINIFWAVMSGICAFTSQWLRSARWVRLLKPIHFVPYLKSFQIYSVGTLINLIIPLRGGDILKALLMAQYLSEDKSSILATVVTERLTDLITFGILLGLSLILYPLPLWIIYGGVILLLSSLGFAVFLNLLKMEKIPLRWVWNILHSIMPEKIVARFQKIILNFLKGLAPLTARREYVFFLIETFLIWFLQGIFIYLLFYSFNFTEIYHLESKAALLILALTSAVLTVPAAPSYAGTLHLIIVLGLETCGVPLTKALAYAIVFHAINTLKGVFAGLYGLISKDSFPAGVVKSC